MGRNVEWDAEIFFAAGLLLFLVSLLLFVLLWIRLGRLNKRYKAMLNGNSGTDYEGLLITIQERWNEGQGQTADNSRAIAAIRESMKKQKAHVEMARYNAFDQNGSEMSFSIAILNDYADGVVLTGIHSREQTYMYAKAIEQGDSKYTLSPEEKKVVLQASAGTGKE